MPGLDAAVDISASLAAFAVGLRVRRRSEKWRSEVGDETREGGKERLLCCAQAHSYEMVGRAAICYAKINTPAKVDKRGGEAAMSAVRKKKG